MFYSSTSISAIYYPPGFTEFKLSGDVPGYCGIGAIVDITGVPEVGDYTVVAASPYVDNSFFNGSKNAYVYGSADVQLPDGGCADQGVAFSSVGGAGTGTVNISEVMGRTVKFTATAVQASGIDEPMCAGMGYPCDGQGTIQIDIKGAHADCWLGQ
jgi:hypothetical protein